MSYDDSETDVVVDPELRMADEDDSDDDDDTPQAILRIQEQQREFVQRIQTVIEPIITENPTHRGSVEATVEGVLGLIEGGPDDFGYVLTKRDDANFAMVPCTLEVYEEHLRDFVDATGLDISQGLLSMFDDVNS
jgi:hypothetical protein